MRKKSMTLGMLFITAILLTENVNVYAATSAGWTVNYLRGAPTGTVNPIAYAKIAYDSDGFYVKCTSIDGSYDRQVEVSSQDAGGIQGGNKYIRTVGTSSLLRMNSSSTQSVTYRFSASGSESCNAKGTVYKKI